MSISPLNNDAYEAVLRVAFSAARAVVDRYRTKLLRDRNVVDVQTGFKFTNGWPTDTPCVVVTVLNKLPESALGDQLLPTELDGIPVDVAPATPAQQYLHLNKTKAGTRAAVATPSGVSAERLLAPGETPAVEEVTRGTARPGRAYLEPKDLKLAPVTGAMTLLCHASPDAGWSTLQKFLKDTKKTLTIAMYDFTAKHVFEGVKDAAVNSSGTLTLNLDRKSNPKREGEMTEEQVVDELKAALKERFDSSTAAVGVLYPNAYHIKVAVRDSNQFWLSSGNWQGSNQPSEDASKLDPAAQRRLLSGHNREWHVISDNAKLAKTFEGYIKFDVAEARRVAADGTRGLVPPALPDLVLPDESTVRAPMKEVKIFPAKKFTFTAADPVRVQPLLTPDNYGENVVKLILSAKKSLYFQNQYIMVPSTFPDGMGKPGLKELVEALLDRQKAGVDLRIILRNGGNAREMLQSMKSFGFDMSKVKMLGGCHNKGIVVDSQVAMVSSQNYSADGVRFNRDAGLIIYSPKVAKYYGQIFEYDWDVRATQNLTTERGAMPLLPEVAKLDKTRGTRAAQQTISWDEFYQD